MVKLTGPRAVASLQTRVDLPKDQIEAALRALVIQISFDGRQTVEAPLGDFFGAAPGINPFQSLPLGVNPNGSMYCHWVMPFQKTAEIRLVNHGTIPVPVAGMRGDHPLEVDRLARCTSTPAGRSSTTFARGPCRTGTI